MKYVINFYNGLMEDLKAFIFWMILLTLFRIIFLINFGSQLPEDAYGDVTACLWLGTRLSLKTAGWICALGFILTTLPAVVYPKFLQWKFRWHAFAILLACILFMARFPYYRAFNDALNGMVITAFHEDWWAILCMIVDEYGIWWRLPVALILTDIFYFALKMFFWYAPLNNFATCQKKWVVIVLSIIGLSLLCVFVRFGGAFTYRRGISWVSAARFSSPLLNAAVLDDGQAVNRVVKIWRLRQKIDNINLSADKIQSTIGLLQGDTQATTIDDAFKKTVQQQRLAHKPQNVVLVLGESLGIWPFEKPFDEMHLVDEITHLQNSGKAAEIGTMLSAGPSTIYAVQSVLTGMPVTGSRYNFENRTDKDSAMYLANIMKRLGYKTVFWYSGFGGWENLNNFVKNLGFDEFYHCGDFDYKHGNSWGASDEEFYNFFVKKLNEQGDTKVLHVLLPGSNHPPYSIDVDDYGFNRQEVKKHLPPEIDDSRSSLSALGHMWYADKCIGDMVRKVEAKYPDTLFVITGDHAERFAFAKEQNDRIRSVVPCVFYGEGVNSKWFAKDSVGSHQQLPATLAEILGNKGFTYSAMLPSMFASKTTFNSNLQIDARGLKQIKTLSKSEQGRFRAFRELAAQRLLNGNKIGN
ncbi:MAG: LTA synthase family protein [Phascolarctobacterium sp.]|nr:LTA synthase family protein [Candidatus Phascolarctobacterium caballi]